MEKSNHCGGDLDEVMDIVPNSNINTPKKGKSRP
jgi:hypothetical protein